MAVAAADLEIDNFFNASEKKQIGHFAGDYFNSFDTALEMLKIYYNLDNNYNKNEDIYYMGFAIYCDYNKGGKLTYSSAVDYKTLLNLKYVGGNKNKGNKSIWGYFFPKKLENENFLYELDKLYVYQNIELIYRDIYNFYTKFEPLYLYKYKWYNHENTKKIVTREFLKKVAEISRKLQINPDDLMAVMAFESWVNPAASNPNGAYGLIQFTEISLEEINRNNKTNYTKDLLKNMNALQQLDLVYLHYEPKTGKMRDLGDVYLVTFATKFVDGNIHSDSTVLYSKAENPEYYNANKGLDKDNKGYITRGDAKNAVIERRKEFEIAN